MSVRKFGSGRVADNDGNQTTRSDGRKMTYNALNLIATAELGTNTTTFQYGPDGDRYPRIDCGKSRAVSATTLCAVLRPKTTSRKILPHRGRRVGRCEHGSPRRVRRNLLFTAKRSYVLPVHMNGRIYDPQLGRMLQADPVQNPGSQGLNRYSYVANNPLTLTDPTGYSFWNSFFGSIVHVVIDAVLYATNNGEFVPWVDAVWAAAATNGNIGATASAFISSYVGGQTSYGGSGGGGWANFVKDPGKFLIAATERAVATGILQGTLATLQGQSFGSAFRSAAISSFASSFGPTGNDIQAGITRAMIGGTASAITGGKFANGAITALAQWAAESATEKYQTAQARKAQDARMDAEIDNYMAGHPVDLNYAVAFEPPALPQSVVDFAAGVGDVASFGLSKYIRSQWDIDGGVDYTSDAYGNGMIVGVPVSVGTVMAGGVAINIGIRGVGGAATLYHFTSAAGAAGIDATGAILPSSGIMGTGVYATSVNSSIWAFGATSTEVVIPFSTTGLRVGAGLWPGTFRVLSSVPVP